MCVLLLSSCVDLMTSSDGCSVSSKFVCVVVPVRLSVWDVLCLVLGGIGEPGVAIFAGKGNLTSDDRLECGWGKKNKPFFLSWFKQVETDQPAHVHVVFEDIQLSFVSQKYFMTF